MLGDWSHEDWPVIQDGDIPMWEIAETPITLRDIHNPPQPQFLHLESGSDNALQSSSED